ncbi:MAG: M23 family metallopeptidase [Clostridia bacterium]
MAVNPAVIKVALMILKDQKNRERVLIAIVSVCMIMLLLVSMIIYIIMEPINQILVALGLKEGETNDEFNEIQNIRLENESNETGTLTFNGTYSMPIETDYGYTITSEFGYRTHPVTGVYKLHSGIDMVGKIHGNILAVADGEIVWAGIRGAYGNCVNIKHTDIEGNTFYSFYAHLSQINVIEGQTVTQGQVIGLQGGAASDPGHGSSTGSHLHFEIRLSQNGNYQNPRKYILQEN